MYVETLYATSLQLHAGFHVPHDFTDDGNNPRSLAEVVKKKLPGDKRLGVDS
jgi:hypothetical protein